MEVVETKYICIDGVVHEITGINEHYFYELPEIEVDNGDTYVVGTEYMFINAVERYYDDMDESDLIDAIGTETIVYNWKCGTSFVDWLDSVKYDYEYVVPSWDSIELNVSGLPGYFKEEVIDAKGGNTNLERYYWDQLSEALGFTPEIALLTFKAEYKRSI